MLHRLPSRSNTMHANATLTPLTRAKMVAYHLAHGRSLRATATTLGVCEKTLRRWLARARAQGFPTRLEDHSSRPRRQPRRTAADLEAQILDLRRQRRTYAQIRTVLPHVSLATLSRLLRRHGLHRLSNLEPPKPPPIRYEHPHPGDLLHLDIKKLGRFARPGVRATGTEPSAIRAPASRVSTSPSTITPASASPASSPTNAPPTCWPLSARLSPFTKITPSPSAASSPTAAPPIAPNSSLKPAASSA